MDLSEILFPFEDTGEGLSLLPLSARRGLDVSGFRLSREGFQSLSYDDRVALCALGAADRIEPGKIEEVLRRSAHPAVRIKPSPEPEVHVIPEPLIEALRRLPSGPRRLDSVGWSRLRGLDRFVLLHALRRSVAHDDYERLELAVRATLDPPGHDMRKNPVSSAPPANSSARRMSDRPTRLEGPSRGTSPPPRLATIPPLPYGDGPATHALRPSAPPANLLSSHLTDEGEVRMVDVGDKPTSKREAIAVGRLLMAAQTAARLARNDIPKGEVLATARVAGILAAKKTSELIPMCHGLMLTAITIDLELDPVHGILSVTARASTVEKTGVEMEALTAVSVACLTAYDMLKGIDRELEIDGIHLVSKSGGTRGPYERP